MELNNKVRPRQFLIYPSEKLGVSKNQNCRFWAPFREGQNQKKQ
jgi:hypothetical protein